MRHLFGEYRELAEQTIFFSNPDELNDPMEALRDYVWEADNRGWERFLKHFLNCLCDTYLRARHMGPASSEDESHINLDGPWIHDQHAELPWSFEQIWEYLDSWLELRDLAHQFASVGRPMRREELESHLSNFHPFSLRILDGIIQGMHESTLDTVAESTLPDLERRTLLFELSREQSFDDDFYISAFAEQCQKLNTHRLMKRINDVLGPLPARSRLLTMLQDEFPRAYLDQLAVAVAPHWSVACFTRDPSNAAMWSNYADGHRGACFIFETRSSAAHESTLLTSTTPDQSTDLFHLVTDTATITLTFQDVSYVDSLKPANFFDCASALQKAGNLRDFMGAPVSRQLDSSTTHGTRASVPEAESRMRTEIIRDCSHKTNEWRAERETRLILWAPSSEEQYVSKRALRYEFESLKGIIFGIKVSSEDKVRIVAQVRENCVDAERTEFEFYQAYYWDRSGKIDYYPMDIEFPS